MQVKLKSKMVKRVLVLSAVMLSALPEVYSSPLLKDKVNEVLANSVPRIMCARGNPIRWEPSNGNAREGLQMHAGSMPEFPQLREFTAFRASDNNNVCYIVFTLQQRDLLRSLSNQEERRHFPATDSIIIALPEQVGIYSFTVFLDEAIVTTSQLHAIMGATDNVVTSVYEDVLRSLSGSVKSEAQEYLDNNLRDKINQLVDAGIAELIAQGEIKTTGASEQTVAPQSKKAPSKKWSEFWK